MWTGFHMHKFSLNVSKSPEHVFLTCVDWEMSYDIAQSCENLTVYTRYMYKILPICNKIFTCYYPFHKCCYHGNNNHHPHSQKQNCGSFWSRILYSYWRPPCMCEIRCTAVVGNLLHKIPSNASSRLPLALPGSLVVLIKVLMLVVYVMISSTVNLVSI